MIKLFSFLTLAFFAFQAKAQTTIHDPNVELRTVQGSFHAIEVSGGIDLYLSKGDESVAVSARDASVRNYIKTEIQNGVLKIWFDWKAFKSLKTNINKSLKAYVSYKMIDGLSASGGSDVHTADAISGNSLRVSISGGSDFSGKVNVSSLIIDASGGSDVNISGSASTLKIDASGGSDFDGYDLVTDTCSIDASGGSDVNITVNKEISAEASGASDVSWKGSAKITKARASGAGSVSHRS